MIRSTAVLRVVIIMWLVVTAGEMCCPAFCDDDRKGDSGIPIAAHEDRSELPIVATLGSESPSDQQDKHTGCVCECLCSSLVTPAHGPVNSAGIAVTHIPAEISTLFFPLPPADAFYRPPRLA